MLHLRRVYLALALASGPVACEGGFLDTIDDIIDPADPEPGVLGRGDFIYICEGVADPQCEGSGVRGDFPWRFAVGNRFGLHYERTDGLLDDITGQPPRSGAPARLEERGASSQGAVFVPRVSGRSPAIVSSDGVRIDDLVYIDAELPEQLVLLADDAEAAALTLAVGDEVELRASARDGDGEPYPGATVVTWSVDDGALVELIAISDELVRVRALAPGEAVLEVEGALQISLPITVTGDGSGGSSDTGDTDASGSASDTGDTDASGSASGSTGGAL